MYHIFGIRHHGPGSARNLMAALRQLQPDLLLIEGPADAEDLIPYVTTEGLHPPVAMLLYNPKNLGQAVHLPFADFSPEWQAIRYGLFNEIPVRFMDLPQSLQFGLDNQAKAGQQLLLELPKELSEVEREQRRIFCDPIGFLAGLSNYSDSERWWEAHFEQSEGTEVFPLIVQMMSTLREDLEEQMPRREQMREAHMRKTLRQAIKEGFQKIAVVCGAWHAPALQQLDRYKSSADQALLRGIKKVSVKGTWIAWTYERLSTQSGYRAGVISPAYYELLFQDRAGLVIQWMIKVARLLRKEDLNASAAHAIEAVRLSETLASMRGLPVPGLEEMREAAVTIFCEGNAASLELINQKLIIGDVVGQVPPSIPAIPLQQDIEKCIKSARLSKERKTTEQVEKELDLRKPTHLQGSYLLHRLNLLNIPWGTEKVVKKYSPAAGSFHEHWKLRWLPDFALRIIEAGMLGNTVYEAAVTKAIEEGREKNKLPALTALLELALKADLKDAIPVLVKYLRSRSALTTDVQHLMGALLPLVNATRYGSVRRMNVTSLEQVITKIIPRICVGLPMACINVDEEEAQSLFKLIQTTHHAIGVLDTEEFMNQWLEVLKQVAGMTGINGLLGGGSTRILYDKKNLEVDAVATKMSYALSKGNDIFQAAYWLEGFLHGSGLLLILNPALWNILDDWVSQIKEEAFKDVLPVLRRTFSGFSQAERRKMMALAKKGQIDLTEEEKENVLDKERAEQVLPTLKLLLGLK